MPLTETFEDDVLTLYGFRGEVETALYDRDFEALEKLLPQLEAAIDAVKDAYLVKQTMPETSSWPRPGLLNAPGYYIQNLKTRQYCFFDDRKSAVRRGRFRERWKTPILAARHDR